MPLVLFEKFLLFGYGPSPNWGESRCTDHRWQRLPFKLLQKKMWYSSSGKTAEALSFPDGLQEYLSDIRFCRDDSSLPLTVRPPKRTDDKKKSRAASLSRWDRRLGHIFFSQSA